MAALMDKLSAAVRRDEEGQGLAEYALILALIAIVVIAAIAAALQAGYGNVDWSDALLLAGPAVVGVALGVALQQRLPERAISALFALLLVVISIELIVP